MSVSNFERVTASVVGLLETSPAGSFAAAVVRPDGSVAVDPKVYGEHGEACLAYVRLTLADEGGCQFIDRAPQRFTVTERPDLGERVYHVTRGTDSEIVRLPA